jgi:hypothetical protein
VAAAVLGAGAASGQEPRKKAQPEAAETARSAAAAPVVREPGDRPKERSSDSLRSGAKARARPISDLLPGTTVNEDGSVKIRTETLTITGRGEEAVAVPPFSPMTLRTRELTITGLGEEAAAEPELTPVLIRTRRLTITGLGD